MRGTKSRARLLDLGKVSALRSQSLYHAIAAVMQPRDDPALILLCPGSALVTVGRDYPKESLDSASWTTDGLPVFRAQTPGECSFHDSGQLCFYLLAGSERVDQLRLSAPPPNPFEALGRASINACRALALDARMSPPGKIMVHGQAIGTVELARIGEVALLRGRLWLEVDSARLGRVEEQFTADSTTSFSQHLAPGKGFPEVADALVAAIEDEHHLELIPSLPTPAELDALLEWDARLANDASELSRRQGSAMDRITA